MNRKQKQAGLGKALKNKLQKKRFIPHSEKAPIFFQETQQNDAEIKKMKMKSVIQQNSLTEFLHIAEMSQQDFHANRNIRLKDVRQQLFEKRIIHVNPLKTRFKHAKIQGNPLAGIQVPRRPAWKQSKGKQELERLQTQAYLNWRRALAAVEQKNDDINITPYEKNIQVWRQLWRVVERADVLAQIVDGRNPLFFYSEDLIAYARQLNKSKFLVIVNKSDLLQEQIRKKWNEYFLLNKIDHCFFTAIEGARMEGQEDKTINTPEVLSPHQLVEVFQKYAIDNKVQIGLVGYPNVGKSSVINAVLGKKKVGVASMPGKTKHFQTLKLTDTVTLCDCPGLVFPKVSESRAEMVLNGLYPIDTLKDYEEPAQIIAYRLKKQKVQQIYAIHWKKDEPYDGQAILVKFAMLKGFYTGNGLPSQAQAARMILKDYVNGVLIYNHPPPSQEIQSLSFEQRQAEVQLQKCNFMKKEQQLQQNLDADFFVEGQMKVKSVEQILQGLQEDDFLDIIQGRKVQGMKITKQMRKQIKFSLKRGSKVNQIRKMLMSMMGKGLNY